MYDRFIVILNENIQSKLSIEKAKLEANYAENLDTKLKELHSIRHDIKNHLIIIDGYLNHNNTEKAREYIQKIQSDFADTYIIDTPCSYISNILNAKYQSCLNYGIKLDFTSNFSNINIDDYQFITILGNLVDNAITAVAKLDISERIITLSITQIESYLEIYIKNKHREKIQKDGKEFLSTKKASGKEAYTIFNGIGLKNVSSTTKKLNGHIKITYTDTTFCVSVILPNY